MNFIKKIINEKHLHLVYIKCTNEDNKQCHAYVVMNENKFKKIQVAKDPVILGDYGTVLYSNEGHEIPAYIEQAVISGFKGRYLKTN